MKQPFQSRAPNHIDRHHRDPAGQIAIMLTVMLQAAARFQEQFRRRVAEVAGRRGWEPAPRNSGAEVKVLRSTGPMKDAGAKLARQGGAILSPCSRFQWPVSLGLPLAPPSGQASDFPGISSAISRNETADRGEDFVPIACRVLALLVACVAWGHAALTTRSESPGPGGPGPSAPAASPPTSSRLHRLFPTQRTGLHPRRQHAGLPGQLRHVSPAARWQRHAQPGDLSHDGMDADQRHLQDRSGGVHVGQPRRRADRNRQVAAVEQHPGNGTRIRSRAASTGPARGHGLPCQVGPARLSVLVQDQSGGGAQQERHQVVRWWAAERRTPRRR